MSLYADIYAIEGEYKEFYCHSLLIYIIAGSAVRSSYYVPAMVYISAGSAVGTPYMSLYGVSICTP